MVRSLEKMEFLKQTVRKIRKEETAMKYLAILLVSLIGCVGYEDQPHDDVLSITFAEVVVDHCDGFKFLIFVDDPFLFRKVIEVTFVDQNKNEVSSEYGNNIRLSPALLDHDMAIFRGAISPPDDAVGFRISAILIDGSESKPVFQNWSEQRFIQSGEGCDPVGMYSVCSERTDVCSADQALCELQSEVRSRICESELPELSIGPNDVEIDNFYSVFVSSGNFGYGAEQVFVLDLQDRSDVTLSTVNYDTPAFEETLIYVRTECDDKGSEVAFNDDVSSRDKRSKVELSGVGPGRFFVVVDTAYASSGGYLSLEVSIEN